MNSFDGSPGPGQPTQSGTSLPVSVEVSDLLRSAAELRNQENPAWTDPVVEANEQLILASLHAQERAQNAVHDLDELTRAQQHDVLTGTPNRALMLDRLEHAMAIARRNESQVAVLFIDLDNFKHINDSLGHEIGDDVLRAAARRLESAVRGSDTVSRHGGDEFLVLLSEISHASDAVLIANKMLSAFSRPVRAGKELVFISASIGIAVFPDDGVQSSALIHSADTAMYLSKRRGPGRYAFHDEAVNKLPDAHAPDVSPRAVAYQAACRLEERNRQEKEQEHAHRLQELREANANLIASALKATQARDAPAAPTTPQLALQAVVAEKLRSSFTPRQESAQLLGQIHTSEPLLQILIEKQIASLSAPVYTAFSGPRTKPARFMRYQTQKTGQFPATGDDGSNVDVLEFTVTAQCGAQDQTRRALTHQSYGLKSGERVERLNYWEFQVAQTGVVLRKN